MIEYPQEVFDLMNKGVDDFVKDEGTKVILKAIILEIRSIRRTLDRVDDTAMGTLEALVKK